MTDPYLDLGAGEVAAQLAWLDQLLGAQLDERIPGLRARIRHEMRPAGAHPVHRRAATGTGSGWTATCTTGTRGSTATSWSRRCAWSTTRTRRADLVDLVVEGLDRYVASLPADGAIDEGYAYWWNGACRLLEALDLLRARDRRRAGRRPARRAARDRGLPAPACTWAATGTSTTPTARPARRGSSPGTCCTGRPGGSATGPPRRTPPPTAGPDEPVAHERQGLGRLLRALTDPDWLAAAPGASPLPRDVWFASTQVLLARPAAGSTAGLTLAVKGGHNGEHHNHNDVGSVVVALGGVPVLVDPGRPTYTAQTFGPDRYAIWTMQSSWHNVPQIRGTAQGHGRGHTRRRRLGAVADASSALTLDLAAAYPRDRPPPLAAHRPAGPRRPAP